MLLDRGGDIVEAPTATMSQATAEAASASVAVALDPRVGGNIHVGNDVPSLGAQAEPHIARFARNPDYLLATFQEGRFTSAGAVDCAYAVSRNGGLSWTRGLIPGLTQASGGSYFRATDPVAAVNWNGIFYLNTLAATDANFAGGAVVVSRSTNFGNTFSPPRVAYRPPTNTVFPDKNWIAVNTFSATPTFGRLVVTFTLFSNSSTAEGAPIVRTYSDDAGLSWSAAAPVHAQTTNAQGSQPAFLPDGRLAIVYWNFGSAGSPGEHLEVVLSNNGGVNFGAPIRIANVTEYVPPSIRSGSFLPSMAVDRIHPNLYVVYQALFGGAPRIMFTKSTNGGLTWTTPIPISNNPTNSPVFNAAIAVSPDGRTLTAAFYDKRANPGPNLRVDMFLAQSFDGGATWQPNIRLSSVSIDAALAPLTSQGYMLGDYLGIAEATNAHVPAVPVWIDTRIGHPDPFIARAGISPQLQFNSWRAARFSLTEIHTAAIGGIDADPDHDAEDNVSEFSSGTDPKNLNSVVHTRADFNADLHTDWALQNPTTGQTAVWYMNGAIRLSGTVGPTAAANWKVIDADNFTQRAPADLLLSNASTGATAIWQMNGGVLRSATYGPVVPAGWSAVLARDFNRDGKADLVLFQSSTGKTVIWYLNGSQRIGSVLGPTLPAGWTLTGSGDFNRDGWPDFLLFNATLGRTVIWYLDGTKHLAASAFGPNLSSAWKLTVVEDLNSDHRPDFVLWNPSTHQSLLWFLNNNAVIGSKYGPNIWTGWEIRGPK
jgi:hypothetical protein